MDSDDIIGNVYEMIFPYSFFSYDYVTSCIKINREIKNLCDNRHVILIIAKFLELSFNRDSSNEEICGKIQTEIQNISLSGDLSLYDKGRLVVGYITGIVDVPSAKVSDCMYFCEKFSDFGFDMEDGPVCFLYNLDNIYMSHLMCIAYPWDYSCDIPKVYIKRTEEDTYLYIFNKGCEHITYDYLKEIKMPETSVKAFRTDSQIKTFMNILELISKKEIDVFADWNEIRHYFEVN